MRSPSAQRRRRGDLGPEQAQRRARRRRARRQRLAHAAARAVGADQHARGSRRPRVVVDAHRPAGGVDREGVDALPFDDLDAARARLRHQVGVEVARGARCRPAARARRRRAAAGRPAAPRGRRRAGRAPPDPSRASAWCACPVSPPPHGLARGKRARSRQTIRPRPAIRAHQRQRRGDAGRAGAAITTSRS